MRVRAMTRLSYGLISLAVVAIWVSAAPGSITTHANGSLDQLTVHSGLASQPVFENTDVDHANTAGQVTFGGGTTDYAFAWGSDGNTLSGSGTMTLSNGHQPEYFVRINFIISDTTPGTISGSLDAAPDNPGAQPFANATVQVRTNLGAVVYDFQSQSTDSKSTMLLLPAGSYQMEATAQIQEGVPGTASLHYSVTPEPAGAMIAIPCIIMASLRRRRRCGN